MQLRASFRPEFLNRLDEIIMFKPLTKDNIGSIVDLMMKDLNQRLADQEITLELDPSAKDLHHRRRLRSGLWCKTAEALSPEERRDTGCKADPFRQGRDGGYHCLYRKRRRADCRCEAEGRDRDCSERSLMACSSGRSRRRPRL